MKKILLFLFIINCFNVNADIKISRTVPVNNQFINNKSLVSRSSKIHSINTQNRLNHNTITRSSLNLNKNSLKNNSVIKKQDVVLRPKSSEVIGHNDVEHMESYTRSGVKNRKIQQRSMTTDKRETFDEMIAKIEESKEINSSCQKQYNDCMDQFCNVIDNRQKRCSCSNEISRYEKAEKSVKNANIKLNEIAQKIRYVGLKEDEIKSIINETEAEMILSKQKDKSESRDMLREIEKIITKPSDVVKKSKDDFELLDLNFDDGFDFFEEKKEISSFANLRGQKLLEVGKKKCANILSNCEKLNASIKQIEANYEVEIEKDCKTYRDGLNKLNEKLLKNINSANNMLQKSRLSVLKNKNEYDIRECVQNLEMCMRNDLVCGKDYFKCLDPEKKYVNEDGKVILGENINLLTENFSADSNDVDNETLRTCDEGKLSGGKWKVIKYLLNKIGTNENIKEGGLCRDVLDKCQNYTYVDKKYDPYNNVVLNYIKKALLDIKLSQNKIISDYATNCLNDMAVCYTNQESQIKSWISNADYNSITQILKGACKSVSLTCGWAILQKNDDKSCAGTTKDEKDKCIIDEISTIFMQKFNSMYKVLQCVKYGSKDSNIFKNKTAQELKDECFKKFLIHEPEKCEDLGETYRNDCNKIKQIEIELEKDCIKKIKDKMKIDPNIESNSLKNEKVCTDDRNHENIANLHSSILENIKTCIHNKCNNNSSSDLTQDKFKDNMKTQCCNSKECPSKIFEKAIGGCTFNTN